MVICHVLHFSASLLKSQKTPSFRTQNIRRSVRPKTLTKPCMCNHKVHTHVTNLHIFTPIHMHWMAPYQYAFQECFVGSTQNSPSLPWAKIQSFETCGIIIWCNTLCMNLSRQPKNNTLPSPWDIIEDHCSFPFSFWYLYFRRSQGENTAAPLSRFWAFLSKIIIIT